MTTVLETKYAKSSSLGSIMSAFDSESADSPSASEPDTRGVPRSADAGSEAVLGAFAGLAFLRFRPAARGRRGM